MDILWVLLLLWLGPAVLVYVITGTYCSYWKFDVTGIVLLIPLFNILILGLVVLVMIDDFVGTIWWKRFDRKFEKKIKSMTDGKDY